MKKYIFKINVGQMPPTRAQDYMNQSKQQLIDSGIIGPFDKVFMIGITEGDTDVIVIEMDLAECLIEGIASLCGKLHKFVK